MKLKICFLLCLCPFFRVFSQEIKPVHPSAAAALRPLQVGDHIPDLLIKNITGLRLAGKPVSEVSLPDFKGKLLILDFWATWCAPCRKMVPVLDSLQQTFGDRLVILPVTYENARVVQPVLAALGREHPFHLPCVTGDIALTKLFPHRSLPHEVWIDAQGVVRAITEYDEVNARNINALLSGGAIHTTVKRDSVLAYNDQAPLLIGSNGGNGSSLIYHSLLTGFIPGLSGGLTISPYDTISGQKFSVRNVPFTWLCRLAFAGSANWFTDSRIRIMSRDSARMNTGLSGQAYDAWLADRKGYCYELQVPPALAPSAFALIKQDLSRLFPQYRVGVEQQSTEVLALVRTSAIDHLKSAGGTVDIQISPFAAHLHNAHLNQLMMRLERQYLQHLPVPITDETGYTGRVDLDLPVSLTSVESINQALAKYDLQLVHKRSTIEMLVIRDAATNLP